MILSTATINLVFDENGILSKAARTERISVNTTQQEEYDKSLMLNEYESTRPVEGSPLPNENIAITPKLSDGMTPVKWNGENWIATTKEDGEWYNYDDKRWANVVLADATFDETTGVLDESQPYSMLVWIPRYAYKITSGWHQDSTQLQNGAGTIEVIFIDTNNQDKNGNIYDTTYTTAILNAEKTHAMSDYVVHPAFDFGAEKLEGFWVGKFETSHTNCTDDVTTGQAEYTGSEVLQIKANVTSWRNIQVSDIYTVCTEMNKENNPYRLNTDDTVVDPHMLKNTEWGAIAYLSKSRYGKETEEVYTNNSSTFIVGNAGSTIDAESVEGIENAYHTTEGQKASTTGNVYGIYDMSGGAWEYVAGYLNNNDIQDTTSEQYGYGKNLILANRKYKDVYTMGNGNTRDTNYTENKGSYGDAIYEVSSNGAYSPGGWYEDSSYYPESNTFLRRGGYYGTDKGIAAGTFAFSDLNGSSNLENGFRVAIPVLKDITT